MVQHRCPYNELYRKTPDIRDLTKKSGQKRGVKNPGAGQTYEQPKMWPCAGSLVDKNRRVVKAPKKNKI